MKRFNLIIARKKHKVTSAQLAIAIGVSKSMISQIENCRCNPSWKLQRRLEQFFGIPASELLAESNQRQQ